MNKNSQEAGAISPKPGNASSPGLFILSFLLFLPFASASITTTYELNYNYTDLISGYTLSPQGTGPAFTTSYPTFAISGDGGNGSMNFSASDTAGIVNSGNLIATGSEFSTSFWFLRANNNTYSPTFMSQGNVASDRSFVLEMFSSAGNLSFLLSTTSGSGFSCGVYFPFGSVQNNVWSHLVFTRKGGSYAAYLNGVNLTGQGVEGSNCVGDFRNPTTDIFQFGRVSSGGNGFNGSMDHIMTFSHALNETEILNLYNYGDINPPVPQISLYSPLNNTFTNNVSLVFNYSVAVFSYPVNCSLNYGGSVVDYDDLSADGSYYFTYSPEEGTNDWFISCNGINSSSYVLTIDRTAPAITDLSYPLSALNVYREDAFSFEALFSDDNLFSYNVSVFNSSGSLYYNASLSDINVTSIFYNDTINVSGWPGGVYNVRIIVWDDHTDEFIDVYETDLRSADKIIYEKEAETLSVESLLKTDYYFTEKQVDRYVFGFETEQKVEEWPFKVYCEQKLYDRSRFYSFPSFVCAHRWVDFDAGKGYTYRVQIIDKNYAVVYVKGSDLSKLTFNSIGGLNNATEDFNITLYYTPGMAQNLSVISADSTVDLSWLTVYDEVDSYLLYRDGSLIYNGSDLYFNDTGLDQLTYYDYVVLTVDALGNINETINEDNSLTIRTTGVGVSCSVSNPFYYGASNIVNCEVYSGPGVYYDCYGALRSPAGDLLSRYPDNKALKGVGVVGGYNPEPVGAVYQRFSFETSPSGFYTGQNLSVYVVCAGNNSLVSEWSTKVIPVTYERKGSIDAIASTIPIASNIIAFIIVLVIVLLVLVAFVRWNR